MAENKSKTAEKKLTLVPVNNNKPINEVFKQDFYDASGFRTISRPPLINLKKGDMKDGDVIIGRLESVSVMEHEKFAAVPVLTIEYAPEKRVSIIAVASIASALNITIEGKNAKCEFVGDIVRLELQGKYKASKGKNDGYLFEVGVKKELKK